MGKAWLLIAVGAVAIAGGTEGMLHGDYLNNNFWQYGPNAGSGALVMGAMFFIVGIVCVVAFGVLSI